MKFKRLSEILVFAFLLGAQTSCVHPSANTEGENTPTKARHGRESKSAEASAPKKFSQKKVSREASITCDTNTHELMDFSVEGNRNLVVCARVHQKLSDTIYEVSDMTIYLEHSKTKQTRILLETASNERRELLMNAGRRSVILFEDLYAEKKFPLFSQEVVCVAGDCFSKKKVCHFKKDPEAHANGLTEEEVFELLKSPKGQVRLLLAALSDYQPAIRAYTDRSPQSVEGEAKELFEWRKNQLDEARKICSF